MKTSIYALFLLLTLQTTCLATLLIDDPFNIDGPLSGKTPPVGGTWMGSGTRLEVTDGALQFPSVNGSVSSSFEPQAHGTTFAAISFEVTKSPFSGGAFFFSFLNSSEMIGRVFISSAGDSSTFLIGIENNLDNPVYWPAALSLNTTYSAVVGFLNDENEDTSVLWINPVDQSSPSVQDSTEFVAESINGIRFRATEAFNQFTYAELLVHSVRVSDDFSAVIPEPSVLGLLVLAIALGLILRKIANEAIHLTPYRVTPRACLEDSTHESCHGKG